MPKGLKLMTVDANFYECPPWLDQPIERKNIQLCKNATTDDVDLFLIALFGENNIDFTLQPEQGLQNIINEYPENGLICGGGIVFYQKDTIIYPGCCCGIETYKETIEEIQNQEKNIWLGHDPFPILEYTTDKITIWSDDHLGIWGNRPRDKSKFQSITYNKTTLINQLQALDNNANDFIQNPLTLRINQLAKEITTDFIDCMYSWLKLK